MLTVRAVNIFTDPQDHATYTVSVFINDKPIWNGEVGHDRPEGAAGLLRRIADGMEEKK